VGPRAGPTAGCLLSRSLASQASGWGANSGEGEALAAAEAVEAPFETWLEEGSVQEEMRVRDFHLSYHRLTLSG